MMMMMLVVVVVVTIMITIITINNIIPTEQTPDGPAGSFQAQLQTSASRQPQQSNGRSCLRPEVGFLTCVESRLDTAG